jgi:hypothetical protein
MSTSTAIRRRISGYTALTISLLHSPFIKTLFVKKYKPTQQPKSSEDAPQSKDETSEYSLPPNRTLFVTNLTYDCTKEDIESIFSTFGPIENIILDSFPDQEKQKQRLQLLETVKNFKSVSNHLVLLCFLCCMLTWLLDDWKDTFPSHRKATTYC